MKYIKTFLLLLGLAPFSQSHALLFTDTINFNNKLGEEEFFLFDLVAQGFNPATDVINTVIFSYDIEDIIADPPNEDIETSTDLESVFINDNFFLFIKSYIPDMDTEVYTGRVSWVPQDECTYSVDDPSECTYAPDKNGLFFSSWQVYTDNLWLNSISLGIDVTRSSNANVDEPSPLLLLIGALGLLAVRGRKIFARKI